MRKLGGGVLVTISVLVPALAVAGEAPDGAATTVEPATGRAGRVSPIAAEAARPRPRRVPPQKERPPDCAFYPGLAPDANRDGNPDAFVQAVSLNTSAPHPVDVPPFFGRNDGPDSGSVYVAGDHRLLGANEQRRHGRANQHHHGAIFGTVDADRPRQSGAGASVFEEADVDDDGDEEHVPLMQACGRGDGSGDAQVQVIDADTGDVAEGNTRRQPKPRLRPQRHRPPDCAYDPANQRDLNRDGIPDEFVLLASQNTSAPYPVPVPPFFGAHDGPDNATVYTAGDHRLLGANPQSAGGGEANQEHHGAAFATVDWDGLLEEGRAPREARQGAGASVFEEADVDGDGDEEPILIEACTWADGRRAWRVVVGDAAIEPA